MSTLAVRTIVILKHLMTIKTKIEWLEYRYIVYRDLVNLSNSNALIVTGYPGNAMKC